MKRICFIVALMQVVCMSLNAQSITADETKDGHRSVFTDYIICRSMTDKMVLSVSLCASVDNGTNEKTILLCPKITTNLSSEAAKDCVMLMRLMDGSVLEFKSVSDSKSEPKVQNVNGIAIRSNELSLSFPIAESQLETISKIGVKKVRIGITPDMYDKEFKKDKVGAAIGSLWDLVKSTLSKPVKSVHDDF